MPRVASEAQSILPPRLHPPSPRSHAEPDTRANGTTFAEMLDSTEPQPAPQQAAPAKQADQPEPKDDRGTDAKPANDNACATESTPASGSGDAKAAKDSQDGVPADTSKKAEDGDATASVDVGGKPKADAGLSPALDAMIVDATAPAATVPPIVVVAVPQPLALTAATSEAVTPETEALTALQAADGGSPNTAPKPDLARDKKPGLAQGNNAAGAAAKNSAAAEPQPAVPEIDVGKEGRARRNGENASELRHAAADLLTKPEISTPAQRTGDAGAALKVSADAMQNLGAAAPANAALANATNAAAISATPPAQSQAQIPAAAAPLAGLAVEIATQVHAGNKHFEIRLDPPELGRIDVKLDFDGDGNVSTRLIVDRADTLDLLKRDASTLERALQQSGLKTSDNALEFSLRQQGLARDDTAARTAAQLIVPDDDPAPLEAVRQGYGRLPGLGGGLDIRV